MSRSAAWLAQSLLSLCALCFYPAVPASAQRRAEKKLIEMRGTAPDPAFMRRHARTMDAVGFDGVVFDAVSPAHGKFAYFGFTWWGTHRFEYADFSQNIEDLRACGFKHLTENFLKLTTSPGDVAWHDEKAFSTILHNAKVAAKIAREGGAKGFMFDVEQYNTKLFRFEAKRLGTDKTFEQYEAVVRQRGRELIRAINSEYPDITIMMTYGYEITGTPATEHYGLLKSFLDGFIEAADERTVLVHAYERAYAFRSQKEYSAAYALIHEDLARVSGVPELYKKRVQAGFGIWLDMGRGRYGWHPRDFARNYFTPDEFAYTLSAALRTTDRYVWIYSEAPLWWPPGPNFPIPRPVPAPYLRALRRARTRPVAVNDDRFPPRAITGDAVRAQSFPESKDENAFAELKHQWSIIADLPEYWSFRVDPRKSGEKQAWYRRADASKGWQEMQIPRFWDETRGPYIGDAWYRVAWQTPAFLISPQDTVALLFGAADETAKVWVNGELVGEHDEGPGGWNRPFAVEVTGKLRPAAMNIIAVRVSNRELAGGLWKNVKLGVRRRVERTTSADGSRDAGPAGPSDGGR